MNAVVKAPAARETVSLSVRTTIEALLASERTRIANRALLQRAQDCSPLPLERDSLPTAESIVGWAPSPRELRQMVQTFDDAHCRKATKPQAEMIVAMVVDSFPNARPPNCEMYLAALVLVAQDEGAYPERRKHLISPEALMAGGMAIIKEQRFPPTASEFHAAVYDAMHEFGIARDRARRLEEIVKSAEAVIEKFGDAALVLVRPADVERTQP